MWYYELSEQQDAIYFVRELMPSLYRKGNMSLIISFILGANVGFLLTCIIVSGKDK